MMALLILLLSLLNFEDAEGSTSKEMEGKDGSKGEVMGASVLSGSAPPNCRNKCKGCRPCVPVILIVSHQHHQKPNFVSVKRGEADYYPENRTKSAPVATATGCLMILAPVSCLICFTK